jgi:phosphoadenosine phosphosulfate reductase
MGMKMLRYTDITGAKIDKVQTAIDRLKSFEPPDGYYLAFSGGKDSCCIKELANMAGVQYDAHYNATTVDPPELVRFIRKYHADVMIEKPEIPMRKLIAKKLMPPTRIVRYCCLALKEGGGEGRVVVTGVRWAESPRRKGQHGVVSMNRTVLNDDNEESRRMVEQCYRTQKTLLNPIVDWLDEDVWEFIRTYNLPYCSLYDEGFKRLGCVGCPMGDTNGMLKGFARWPQYKKLYIKSFDEMLKERSAKGKKTKWETGEDVFNWWINGGSEKVDENQILMDMDPNGDEGAKE